MELLLIFLIFITSVIFVAQPLFKRVALDASKTKAELAALESEKLSLYHQIKQIEMEHDLSLLSLEDFRSARQRLKLEQNK